MNSREPQPLRASHSEIEACLDALDQAGVQPSLENRVHNRRRFRIPAVEVRLTGPSHDTRLFLAATRNISPDGISIILPQFVHLQSPVSVRIPKLSGTAEVQQVEGHVVRCRYLSGTRCLHEIGVHFARSISIEPLQVAAKIRRLTILSQQTGLSQVLSDLLRPLNFEMTQVNHVEEIQFGSETPTPLAYVVDFESVDSEPQVTIRTLRAEHPSIAILALITPSPTLNAEHCTAMGCDAVICRPLSKAEIAAAMKRISSPPMIDNTTNRAEILRMIERFMASMPERLELLDAALRGNDLASLEKLVVDTRDGATDAGFDVITRVACELEESLHRGIEEAQTQKRINELARLCLAAGANGYPEGEAEADSDPSKGDDSK
jgi:DNA-binding NarL/FixJ family response regulator